MKKLVFFVLAIILTKISLSQSISYRSNGVVTVSDMRLQAEKNFFVPRYNDTTEANLNKGIDSCGALIFSRDVNAFYYRACNPKKWTAIAGGSGSTPTLQQVLTQGSTVTSNNVITGTTRTTINQTGTSTKKSEIIFDTTQTTFGVTGLTNTSSILTLQSNNAQLQTNQTLTNGAVVELFKNPKSWPLALAAGIAAVAAGTALKSKINNNKATAFANGGIVSGPTMGLVGEYPGAQSNPEVIAPLDKLKEMIGGGGGGTFVLRGQDLLLSVNRAQKASNLKGQNISLA